MNYDHENSIKIADLNMITYRGAGEPAGVVLPLEMEEMGLSDMF